MSNFSKTYRFYLRGYSGDRADEGSLSVEPSQCQAQAHALGVYHRVAAKPPMMSSVAVVAELQRMRAEKKQSFFDVVLKATDRGNIIAAIKGVREVTSLGLKESKDIVDRVNAGASEIVLAKVSLERANASVRVLRSYGCTVEIV